MYCHPELYKANRRNEVRTSEPVCRADSESHNWTDCKGRNNFKTLWICRGLWIKFGLFGRSENSSFSSTLRAWFAFAHTSPYRKSNRSDALAGVAGDSESRSAVQNDDKSNPLTGHSPSRPSPIRGRSILSVSS